MSIHDNKYWSRRVEELATQISPTDDTTFFGSDAYREYTEDAAKNMVSGVCTYLRTLGYDITEKEEDARAANLMVGMSTNKNMTACTDGNFVTVGVCSDIVTYFDSRELKHYAIQGLRVHEIGHVLFTDFPTSARWSSALKNGNWWPNAPKRASETAGAELTQMLKNPDFAPGFEKVAAHIENAIEDGFIEREIQELYKGLATTELATTNDALISTSKTFGEKAETISDEMLTFMSTDDIMDAAMQQELPTRYAIELCSWDEILGWKLAPSSIYIYGLEFCLSRVLWEMTFFGVEPHGVEQAKADLDASIEESKKNLDENGKPHGIPFEDFVKELLGDDYTEDWYPEEEQERDRRNMAIASYKGNKEAEYLLLML